MTDLDFEEKLLKQIISGFPVDKVSLISIYRLMNQQRSYALTTRIRVERESGPETFILKV